MIEKLSLAPSNSLVFISGNMDVEVPIHDWPTQVCSNSQCLSVACLPDVDGDTNFEFGNEGEIRSPLALAFDGEIETPDRKILVSTVPMEILFSADVPNDKTRVTVRLNHDKWPDQVIIGWN